MTDPAAGAPSEAVAQMRNVLSWLAEVTPRTAQFFGMLSAGRAALDTLERELERLLEAQAQLAARPALEWIRGGEGSVHGGHELVVFELDGSQGVTCARWDGDKDCWLDDETDGQNERIEWYPGQIRWHIPTSAILDALPPAPKPPEGRSDGE